MIANAVIADANADIPVSNSSVGISIGSNPLDANADFAQPTSSVGISLSSNPLDANADIPVGISISVGRSISSNPLDASADFVPPISFIDVFTVSTSTTIDSPNVIQTIDRTIQTNTINAYSGVATPGISIGIEVQTIAISTTAVNPSTVGTGVSPNPDSISITTSILEPHIGFLTATEIPASSSISAPTISTTEDADVISSTVNANTLFVLPGIFDYNPSIPVTLAIDTLSRVNDVDIYYELSKTVQASTISIVATIERNLISGPPDIDWLFGGIELAWKFDTLSLQALIIDPEEFTSG